MTTEDTEGTERNSRRAFHPILERCPFRIKSAVSSVPSVASVVLLTISVFLRDLCGKSNLGPAVRVTTEKTRLLRSFVIFEFFVVNPPSLSAGWCLKA